MDYIPEDGRNLIQEWYEAQDEAVQVAFDYALKEILGTEDLTDSKQFKPLKRQHVGLWEVVVEVGHSSGKRQFRPVGFWNYDLRDFILVNACQKSGRFTVPPGVFDSALDILEQYFHEGRGIINEHSF
jgi:hypothetical protein